MSIDSNQYSGIPQLKEKEYWGSKTIYEENYSPFNMIGEYRTMRNNSKKDLKDVFEILGTLSKGAYQLFIEFKSNLDPDNNLIYYSTKNFNKGQKVMFSRYTVELIKADIIKKAKTTDKLKPIKKGSFMVNPRLLIPKHFHDAKAIWDYLK